VMYIVFFCFFTRLLLRLFSTNLSSWSSFSIKWLYYFYKNIFFLFFKFFKFIFQKFI
jgi:hypothetical protein